MAKLRRVIAPLFFAAACAHAPVPTSVAPAAVFTLDATASCVGPTGRKWTTRVASARDGRFLFEQTQADGGRYSGGFDGTRAWECADPDAPCGALDEASR
ncbi:MAG TPA: hypothetical protein VE404_08740, partial [Verrucomicrobiae bacterium]|nr:hypothetical protein [Verrucomicrobiae bacterium]